MMDHRCSPRTDTHTAALLRVNGGWIPAIILNLSEGGLYVEAARLPAITNARVDIRTAHPMGYGCDFPALVIHRHRRGVGLLVMGSEEEQWLARISHTPPSAAAGFTQP